MFAVLIFYAIFAGFGCGTLSNARVTSSVIATYSQPWVNGSYEKLFNATMYALNVNNETVIEANRSSGTIHTRIFNENGQPEGNGFYLIVSGSNAVFYSASTYFEKTFVLTQLTPATYGIKIGSEAESEWIYRNKAIADKIVQDKKDAWKSGQENFIQKINLAFDILQGKKSADSNDVVEALKNLPGQALAKINVKKQEIKITNTSADDWASAKVGIFDKNNKVYNYIITNLKAGGKVIVPYSVFKADDGTFLKNTEIKNVLGIMIDSSGDGRSSPWTAAVDEIME